MTSSGRCEERTKKQNLIAIVYPYEVKIQVRLITPNIQFSFPTSYRQTKANRSLIRRTTSLALRSHYLALLANTDKSRGLY